MIICAECRSHFHPKKAQQRFCSKPCASRHRARGRRDGSANPNWRGGKTKHPLYDVYLQMISRCHNPRNPRYADYGGRGIAVCGRWRDDFWAFVADVGERPAGVGSTGRSLWSIDRINNDRGYEPGNVRWANYSQQQKNARPAYLRRARNAKGQFS